VGASERPSVIAEGRGKPKAATKGSRPHKTRRRRARLDGRSYFSISTPRQKAM
jgi:hypothetical protein